MKNVTFMNFEKQRVLFVPDDYDIIYEYFEINENATLIIDFYELINYSNFNSFDCLKKIRINKLLLTGSKRAEYDVSELMKMKELKLLDNRNIELEYDFLNFPELEVLIYTWIKKCKNISSLKKLKELSLWSYKPKSQDLIEFSEMSKIEELRIIQSNITTISGSEKMPNLNSLILISNRNLSLEDLDCIYPNVESLYIESCKKINDNFVKFFPNLKKLEFSSNAPIDSLKNILENLKKLEYLNVAENDILESDNRYWKDYKNVKINFLDRKHHILKRKDFGL